MTDVNSRIEAAKAELNTIQSEVDLVRASKRDIQTSLPSIVRGKGGAATALRTIRSPPATKCRRVLKGHFGKVTALHWTGDSKSLVSASQDGKLILWNAISTNKNGIINLKSSYVLTVGVEQTKGNLVACGGLDNLCTIYKFNPNTQGDAAVMELASHEGFLSCCRFISQDKIMTASGDSTCILWDVSSGRVLQTLTEHTADVVHLSLGPSNNTMLTASVDKTVKLWDLRMEPTKSVKTFAGYHEGDVNGVEFMPHSNGTAFGTASDDGTCRVFDVRAYAQVAKFGKLANKAAPGDFAGEGFTSCSFSQSGRLLFCGHADGSVMAFDVLSDKHSPAFVLNGHDAHVTDVAVNPKGDALCTASWDTTLRIWA